MMYELYPAPSSPKMMTCPICEKLFREDSEEAALPFCSKRCKRIDTARWLDEAYGLPDEKMHETPDWDEESCL